GEFGGLGLFVQGHTWEEKNWGYRKMDDSLSLLLKYEQFYTRVWDMKKNNGLSASVYTQTTDVETETNGLMTYDREVVKMDPATLHGINTGDYVPAPVFTNEDGTFNTAVKVELTAARGEIRYTLDGSLPDIDSKVYTAPVELMKSAVFSAAAFDGNRMSMVVTKSFTLTEKKPLVYMSPFDNRYSGGGFFALIDGKYGSLNYSDGKWQGFRTVGLDAVVDLGAPKKISSVSANFLVNHEGWIFLPTSFKVFTSDDMKQFTLQGEITGEIPKDFEEARTQKLTVGGLDVTARYVRISAPTAGPAPAWLTVAKGRPTWLFIDEVVIE
ncbi:MAG TPA: chitobiase/beta-hexosaminidase C-terminal domain-containing protein, partial [Bacteroidales bacterium]|nr:chitobiase/beta-hexosaminidase C-terminal domain-containing protein [Bacteroidales bacterium]